MEHDKGKTVSFVKGVHADCAGWLNKSRKTKKGNPFGSMIVHVEEANEGSNNCIRVKDNFCHPSHKDPVSHEEAALQQHPDMELHLAEMFAECGVTEATAIGRLFTIKFVMAVKCQHSLNGKASTPTCARRSKKI